MSINGRELKAAFDSCSTQDEAVSLLAQYSSTIVKRTKGSDNYTLLHGAAERGWTRVCQVLVEEHEVKTECRDTWGRTPLHWACDYNRTDTVQYLVANGYSDPLIKNNNGETPFDGSSEPGVRDYLEDIIG